MSIIDVAGKNITLTKYPTRMVSLAPAVTEAVFGLDLGSKLVGTVSYAAYTNEIKLAIPEQNIIVVGTFNKVNIELVIGLQPDLIIATGTFK